MRTAVAAIAAVGSVIACGCGSKSKQHRAGDAAPVEVVHESADASTGSAGAVSGDEVEPNDSDDVATPLAVGATLRGRIDPDTDTDAFRIELHEPGVLALGVSAVDGVDLTLEVVDAGGTSLARSDRGGVKVSEGVPNLAVAPGRYTAIVRAKKPPPAPPPKKGKKGAAPAPAAGSAAPSTAAVYEISCSLAARPANAEIEPDDDRGTANDLIVGDTATGFVGWSGDADWWKLSIEALSAKNVVDIEVSAVEGVALTVEVSDAMGRVLLARKGPRGAPLVIRRFAPVIAQGAAPYHYIAVKGDRSNYETPYQLRVTEKLPDTDGEVEPDDAPDHAMALAPDRTKLSGTWSPGDVDYLALPVAQGPRPVDLTLDPPSDADLSIELLVDGKVIAKSERPGKGVQEKLTGVVPAGVQALVRVKGVDSGAEGAYDLSYQDGPGAP